MAAQRHLAELAHDHEQYARPAPRHKGPFLAHEQAAPCISPARMLQDEVRRAFSPGPILCDKFSSRRAAKFIGPTWAGAWVLLAVVRHLGHH